MWYASYLVKSAMAADFNKSAAGMVPRFRVVPPSIAGGKPTGIVRAGPTVVPARASTQPRVSVPEMAGASEAALKAPTPASVGGAAKATAAKPIPAQARGQGINPWLLGLGAGGIGLAGVANAMYSGDPGGAHINPAFKHQQALNMAMK